MTAPWHPPTALGHQPRADPNTPASNMEDLDRSLELIVGQGNTSASVASARTTADFSRVLVSAARSSAQPGRLFVVELSGKRPSSAPPDDSRTCRCCRHEVAEVPRRSHGAHRR